MKATIARGREEEYQEIIDFGDMVFHEDFKSILPKLYVNHPEMAKHHFLVREEDTLKAMAGSFPNVFYVGDYAINSRGIGTVSVHPDSRGKGYMIDVMQAALQEAEREQVDLLYLGGERQRYEHFGFGKSASLYRVMVTRFNQKHCSTENHVAVVPLAERMEFLQDCHALHLAQPVSTHRPWGAFMEITASWGNTVYVLLDGGTFLGYAAVGGVNPLAQEILLKDDTKGADAAFALLDALESETLELQIEMYQKSLLENLTKVCSYGVLREGEMLNVRNYPKVLEAYLTLKAQSQELMDGELVLEVLEHGRFLLSVKGNQVKVTDTDRPGDISLPHIEMMYYLFAPLGACRHRTALEKSWFPVPVVLPQADMS